MEIVERIVVAVLLLVLFILWVVNIEKRQKRLDRAKEQIEDLANTIADIRKEKMMNDSISRRAAIEMLNYNAELLRRVLDNADVVGAERAKYAYGLWVIESCISDMEKLPSAQRWIPVTERLPEKHSSAIVTDFGYVTFAYTNNLDEWMDYDGNRLKNVTAWMPLPEPYREEDDWDAKI